jgi:VanZ family protein
LEASVNLIVRVQSTTQKMKLNLLALICVAVLCITLSLGLWPFHSPANRVSWLGDRNGLRFNRRSTVISSGSLQIPGSGDNSGASLEIWIRNNRIWDFATLLAFYKSDNLFQFSLRQSQLDLLIRTGSRDDEDRAKSAKLHVRDAFQREQRPVFITVTSAAKGAWIYLNGVPAVAAPDFPLSAADFTGRLVLGDSPGQTDSWAGELLGFAIYHRQLSAAQSLHHYVTWKQTGRPAIAEDERNAALYLFDERTGTVVRDKAGSGVDLDIPERYEVMNQIFLEPIWSEFSMSRSYWTAVLKNIVGFIPFGVCFYAYLLTGLSVKRASLVTVALGTACSLTIEVLQAFLPTRDSGTTDIITNTLGTWIGVAAYKQFFPMLARLVPGEHVTRQLYTPLSHYLLKRSKT